MTDVFDGSRMRLGENRGQPDLTLGVADTRLAQLESRYFTTYRARLAMEKRLSARSRAWNAALIALTSASSLAGVSLLVDESIYGPRGALLLTLFGLLTLVASLVVTNAQYGVRARAAAENYRAVQQLSVVAERLRTEEKPHRQIKKIRQLEVQYQDLMNHSENHSAADYVNAVGILRAGAIREISVDASFRRMRIAMRILKSSVAKTVSVLASLSPWLFMVLSAWLLFPVIRWLADA